MIFLDLENYLSSMNLDTSILSLGSEEFLVISKQKVGTGTQSTDICDVAIKRTNDNPWLPEAKIHVRPKLTDMGTKNSQPSPLGEDWQYLSRRFDYVPTPRTFYAHILSVLSEF